MTFRQARCVVTSDDLAAMESCLSEMGVEDTEWYTQLLALRGQIREALGQEGYVDTRCGCGHTLSQHRRASLSCKSCSCDAFASEGK